MAKVEIIIKIKTFDPESIPWPKEIIHWPHDGFQPRDCSFGFVESKGKKIHIKSGDKIITVGDNKFICTAEDYPAFMERFKIRASSLIEGMMS